MKLKVSSLIKIVLAILFFLCLADWPYGYYEIVRFIALVGFFLLAYHGYNQSNLTEILIYGSLGLLFQPFLKIALGRELWNVVDVIVGLGLIISLIMTENKIVLNNIASSHSEKVRGH